MYAISVSAMCISCDYCVYHYKSTELVSLYSLDSGLLNKYYYYYYCGLNLMKGYVVQYSALFGKRIINHCKGNIHVLITWKCI